MRYFLGRLFALVVLIFVAGCQMMPPAEVVKAPAANIEVPFISQKAYQCGPAALGMLLAWNHQPESNAELVNEVWLPKRRASLLMELKAAGRARNLLAYPVDSTEALFSELQQGNPVLVLQNLLLSYWPVWHFAVVTGYSETGRYIVMHSGTKESKRVNWNRFIKTWQRAGMKGFVLVSANHLPLSAKPRTLMRTITELPQPALSYWQAAVKAFPDDAALAFGLANALWSNQATRAQALAEYNRVVALDPDFAAGWNNLAYARLEFGDQQAAIEAVCRAFRLAPDNTAISDSQQEILAGESCPVERVK